MSLQTVISFCTLILHLSSSLEIVSPDSIHGIYYHIRSHFGRKPSDTDSLQNVVIGFPDLGACTQLSKTISHGNVVLLQRGPSVIDDTIIQPDHPCNFATKVYNAQQAGAVAAIVGNDEGDHEIVPMYENSGEHLIINISSVSVSRNTFETIHKQLKAGTQVKVKINNYGAIDDSEFSKMIERWITAILSTLMLLGSVSLIIAGVLSFRVFVYRFGMIWDARQRRFRMSSIPTIKYSSDLLISEKETHSNQMMVAEPIGTGINEENIHLISSTNAFIGNELRQNLLHNDTCNVCLEDFVEGEEVKLLNCKHAFHEKCIKTWIIKKGKCPVCVRDVFES